MSADSSGPCFDVMTDEELAVRVLDACRRHAEIEREMAGLLAMAQQRRFWAEQGSVSLAAWVETRSGQRREDVNRLRKLGEGIRSFPALAELPIANAQLVLSCKPTCDEDVDLLVGLGHKLPLRDFAVATQRWKFLRDANGTEPEPEPARSELHLFKLLNGSYSVRGTLTGTDAQIIVAALEGEVDRALRNGRDRDPADEGLTVPGRGPPRSAERSPCETTAVSFPAVTDHLPGATSTTATIGITAENQTRQRRPSLP